MPIHIAICGKICSGKSTLAKYLEDKHNFKILSFANSVKKFAREIFNMKHKDRKLLQEFSEKLKEIDNDIWIKHFDKQLLMNQHHNIVVDDLRFPNEYNFLINKSFTIIRLDINNELQIQRIKETYKENYNEHLERLNHISESFIYDFDCHIIIDISKITNIDEFIKNDILTIF